MTRPFCFESDPTLTLHGAKLEKLTQAIAYAGIRERKAPVLRKFSVNNVTQVITAIKNNFNHSPTPAQVWKSIRHKDFTCQVKNFLWKSLHSAHRIGAFWKHIPECEECAICQFCDEPEDLEHILLKCKHPGQELVWKLAKDLWLCKNPIWPDLSLGSVLGCGLTTILDEKGCILPGASHLYQILISESIYLIWNKVEDQCQITRFTINGCMLLISALSLIVYLPTIRNMASRTLLRLPSYSKHGARHLRTRISCQKIGSESPGF
ncbi:hypothetical protein B0H13DRAFT_1636094 [Mycena leptocephala]|nr:hypothetical protein B0H13DRAFT_1636094 [Mycena leptocephala]